MAPENTGTTQSQIDATPNGQAEPDQDPEISSIADEQAHEQKLPEVIVDSAASSPPVQVSSVKRIVSIPVSLVEKEALLQVAAPSTNGSIETEKIC